MKIIPNFNQYREMAKKYSESMQEEKKQKFIGYLYITLTLFTLSFFGLFAIRPTLSTISNLDKQYKDNLLVYKSLKDKLSALQNLDIQYQEIQPDLELVYSAIPKASKIPYLTRQLENLAFADNLTITHLSFDSVEIYPNKKNFSMYSFKFTISVEGSNNDVNKFIADFINFDRIIGIDHLVSGKTIENKFGASIGGRAFFSTN